MAKPSKIIPTPLRWLQPLLPVIFLATLGQNRRDISGPASLRNAGLSSPLELVLLFLLCQMPLLHSEVWKVLRAPSVRSHGGPSGLSQAAMHGSRAAGGTPSPCLSPSSRLLLGSCAFSFSSLGQNS